MDDERKEYTFLWSIENYSYCSHKNGEDLTSPHFTADGLEGTVWTLHLYPRGDDDDSEEFISLFVNRNETDSGPKYFPLEYEFSVLAADGSSLRTVDFKYTFRMGDGYGSSNFLWRNKVLYVKRSEYIPEDILHLKCKMWIGEGNLQPFIQINARTHIGIKHMHFQHIIEEFSKLEPEQKKSILLGSSKKGLTLSSCLYIANDINFQRNIIVEITPSCTDFILMKFDLFLLDVSGKSIQCGKADNRFNASTEIIEKLPLILSREDVLNKKSELLPDDKLFLLCKCSFSIGVEHDKIESIVHKKPFVHANHINKNHKNDVSNSTYSSALDDFKAVYTNQFLTDMELKTETKTFHVHKIVLCARSPVFQAMMSNDMIEKNCNTIKINDLSDDIVQQLLLFLYSDYLEELHWETATKLYYAADKYEIIKLKVICSDFLKDNLNVSTATELLLLADTHNDCNLKRYVEDFILDNEDKIFSSEEWEKLIETSPQLVIKTMHLKYRRNKVN